MVTKLLFHNTSSYPNANYVTHVVLFKSQRPITPIQFNFIKKNSLGFTQDIETHVIFHETHNTSRTNPNPHPYNQLNHKLSDFNLNHTHHIKRKLTKHTWVTQN